MLYSRDLRHMATPREDVGTAVGQVSTAEGIVR